MSSNVSTIVGLLPLLSKRELTKVRAALEFHLSPSQQIPDISPDVRLFYDVLDRVLFNNKLPPLDTGPKPFATTKWFPSLDLGVSNSLALLNERFHSSRDYKARWFTIIARATANRLTDADAPVSLGSICTSLPNIETTLDYAFPGYRLAGLLDVLMDGVKPVTR